MLRHDLREIGPALASRWAVKRDRTSPEGCAGTARLTALVLTDRPAMVRNLA